jgi:hypothetical protein
MRKDQVRSGALHSYHVRKKNKEKQAIQGRHCFSRWLGIGRYYLCLEKQMENGPYKTSTKLCHQRLSENTNRSGLLSRLEIGQLLSGNKQIYQQA